MELDQEQRRRIRSLTEPHQEHHQLGSMPHGADWRGHGAQCPWHTYKQGGQNEVDGLSGEIDVTKKQAYNRKPCNFP